MGNQHWVNRLSKDDYWNIQAVNKLLKNWYTEIQISKHIDDKQNTRADSQSFNAITTTKKVSNCITLIAHQATGP